MKKEEFFNDLFRFIHFSIKKINISAYPEGTLRPLDVNDRIRSFIGYASILASLPDFYKEDHGYKEIASYFMQKSIELLDFSFIHLKNRDGLFCQHVFLSKEDPYTLHQNNRVIFRNQLTMLDSIITIAEYNDSSTYSLEINTLVNYIQKNHISILSDHTRTLNTCITQLYHLYEFLDIPWLPSVFMQYGAELHSRISRDGIFKKFDSEKPADFKTLCNAITALQYCYKVTDFSLFEDTAKALLEILEKSASFQLLSTKKAYKEQRIRLYAKDIASLLYMYLALDSKKYIPTFMNLFYYFLDDIRLFEFDEHHCKIYAAVEQRTNGLEIARLQEEAEEYEYLLFIAVFSQIAKALF